MADHSHVNHGASGGGAGRGVFWGFALSGWLQTRFPGIDFLSHDAGHLHETLFGWKPNPHFGPFHILSSVFIAGGFWPSPGTSSIGCNASVSSQRAVRMPASDIGDTPVSC